MKFISETTLIPVGTAILVFGTGAVFITRLAMTQEAQAVRMERQQSEIDKNSINYDHQTKYFQEIRERLVRIEVLLDQKRRN